MNTKRLAARFLASVVLVAGTFIVPIRASAWERPCEYVEVEGYWVRQCSPFVHTAIECWTYTRTNPEATVEICYPTEP